MPISCSTRALETPTCTGQLWSLVNIDGWPISGRAGEGRRHVLRTILRVTLTLWALGSGLGVSLAQTARYVTPSAGGHIEFVSKASWETIQAHNKRATATLDMPAGQVRVRVPMDQFQFKKPLMQKHYNERYLHTARYPFATLEGRFATPLDLSRPGPQTVEVVGELNMHGVKQPVRYPVTIEVSQSGLPVRALGGLPVILSAHDVPVPWFAKKSIADQVDVTYTLPLELAPRATP